MKSLLELHNIDVASFMSLLDRCKGNVYLGFLKTVEK